jgi:hypothetical protein
LTEKVIREAINDDICEDVRDETAQIGYQ